MYLLYLLYLLHAHVLNLLLCSTYYVCDRYCACILYARTAPIDVLHAPTYDARTCIEEEKIPAAVSTYLLLYVRIYCTYLVLVHLLMYVRTYCIYCCSYWCTYVPTVRTALTNALSTRLLLHQTPVPPVRIVRAEQYVHFVFGQELLKYSELKKNRRQKSTADMIARAEGMTYLIFFIFLWLK